MTCPACATVAEPALTLGEVHICAHCGMSVAHGQRATYRDVAGFTSDELSQLRAVSGPITRAFTLANRSAS